MSTFNPNWTQPGDPLYLYPDFGEGHVRSMAQVIDDHPSNNPCYFPGCPEYEDPLEYWSNYEETEAQIYEETPELASAGMRS